MASKTEIWNMALAHVGSANEVSSETLDDVSPEFITLNRFSRTSLNDLKRRHMWQAFTRYADLQQVAECPNKNWNFAYKYPNDCLLFRKILSEIRNDNEKSKIPFDRGRIRGEVDSKLIQVIFTDHAEPVGVYTEDENELTDYDEDFAIAWSYRLAYFIAPALTGGDPFQLQRAALNNFRLELGNAIKMDQIERERDPYPKSKYNRARQGNRGRRIDGERGALFPDNSGLSD